MQTRARSLLFFLAFTLSRPFPAEAQTVAPQLVGVVLDSSGTAGIAGVEVTIEGVGQRTFTDERGAFRLPAAVLPVQLRLRRLGYAPLIMPVLSSDDPLRISAHLRASAQHLQPVVVRARRSAYNGRLAGYYQRLERRSIGTFITRADIERDNPRMMTHLLQRIPGVQLSRGIGQTRQNIRLRGRNCWPVVWLDGAAMSSGDVDIDAFAPSTLEGIEVYLGGTTPPGQYLKGSGLSECGTILLWSRGPDTDPIVDAGGVTASDLEAMVRAATIFTAEQVDTAASMIGESLPAVDYPQALRALGIDGQVVAEFVVDADGRVEAQNFGIVSATDARFVEPVREALRQARFRAAVKGGAAVRQVVRAPFVFQSPRHDRD